MFSEITNIGQHLRILIDNLGGADHPIRIVNAATWAVGFLLIRILPIPYVLWQQLWIGQNSSMFTAVDTVVMWCTVPLPSAMNVYWFYLIVSGILDALAEKKKDP